MVRNVFSKVMWVGRATVFLVGLSVILAVMLGVATTAAAHSGSAGLFHLDHNNSVATVLTKLTGTLSGAVLTIDNNGTGPALNLQVEPTRPPLTVKAGAGTATNLSADRLDGLDSSAFIVESEQAAQDANDCDTGSTVECAPVTVRVPAGKEYHVSVWSSFSAAAQNLADNDVNYCSAVKESTWATPVCLTADTSTPSVGRNSVTIEGNDTSPGPLKFTSAATSGETGYHIKTTPLSAGSYTFSTLMDTEGAFAAASNDWVITKVQVRDVTNVP
jgi:hypothetical protein